MHENLRLVMVRALAGFDLQLPRKGETTDFQWPQYQSLVLQAPSSVGTQGAADVGHRIKSTAGESVIIETAGRGLLAPAVLDLGGSGPANLFAATFSSEAIFDTDSGILTERVWTALAEPTPSSLIADGMEGLSYIQNGILRYLGDESGPDLGASQSFAAPGNHTALNQWQPLGATPSR